MNSYHGKPYSISSKPSQGSSIEYFEDDFREAEELLYRLRALGVELTIEEDRLAFDAPIGVLTESLLAEMKALRDELIACLSGTIVAAETFSIPGVICPFCVHDQFVEESSGWRCKKCDRMAWGWVGRSFVRADYIHFVL